MAGQTPQQSSEWADQILQFTVNKEASVPQNTIVAVATRDMWVEDFAIRYGTGQAIITAQLKHTPTGADLEGTGTVAITGTVTVPTATEDTLLRATIDKNNNFVPAGAIMYVRFSGNPSSMANVAVTVRATTRRH